MSKYKLYHEDETIIHEKCVDVKPEEYEEVFTQFHDLVEFMEECKGLGLAANQVGDNRRYFVALLSGKVHMLINPVITEKKAGTNRMPEGCLSIPGKSVEVKRATKIKLSYYAPFYGDEIQNEDGETVRPVVVRRIEKQFKGMDARVIQHEMDHLNGRTIRRYE